MQFVYRADRGQEAVPVRLVLAARVPPLADPRAELPMVRTCPPLQIGGAVEPNSGSASMHKVRKLTLQ